MVDSRIARWVNEYVHTYPEEGAQLSRCARPKSITIYNWEFCERWVQWNRWAARTLSERTRQHWRARDVEMAAFQNWGEFRNGGPLLPAVTARHEGTLNEVAPPDRAG